MSILPTPNPADHLCTLEFRALRMLRKQLIGLAERGYGDRDRILRKLAEELGEYAEALEYFHGASRKVEKFSGVASPQEKLQEEALDLLMMAFAAVQAEGIGPTEACQMVADKLESRDRRRRSDEQKKDKS